MCHMLLNKCMTYIFPETTMVKQLTLKGTLVTVPRDHQPIKMRASGTVLPEGNPFRQKKSKGTLNRAWISLFPPDSFKIFCYKAFLCPKTCSQQSKKDYLYVPTTFLTCICFTYPCLKNESQTFWVELAACHSENAFCQTERTIRKSIPMLLLNHTLSKDPLSKSSFLQDHQRSGSWPAGRMSSTWQWQT